MTKYLAHFTLNLPSKGPFLRANEDSGANPHDWLSKEICNRHRAVFEGASTPATACSSRRRALLGHAATTLAAR